MQTQTRLGANLPAEKKSWTHPMCESCWIETKGVFDDETMELKAVPRPVTIRDSDLGTCCMCGLPTFIGIYIRANPDDVPYPATETE